MAVDYSIEDGVEIPDAPPVKRGPGRPRGSRNGTRTASPRATRAPRPDAARVPRTSPKTWIREQCATLVAIVNLGLVASPYREDALDESEMSMVTDALVAECMTSERIKNWLTKAAGISPHIMLITAAFKIAMPRLARRGLIPNEMVANMPPTVPMTFETEAQYVEYMESVRNAASRNGTSPEAEFDVAVSMAAG